MKSKSNLRQISIASPPTASPTSPPTTPYYTKSRSTLIYKAHVRLRNQLFLLHTCFSISFHHTIKAADAIMFCLQFGGRVEDRMGRRGSLN
ncbi:uncharacterized protein YALI1_B01760g [Yarrowia lipolytica]|uniref:Uncharacterized protein n=1 Tax=Yarrowia lipolytica TaxID=4952 RepID=A0A1D8N5Z7_YARLL|nr:hypothetical protein YALI1_B01760g [Yarrowia lipolytica]